MLENFRGQIDWFHLEKTGLSYSKWFAQNDRSVREGVCDGVMRERLNSPISSRQVMTLRKTILLIDSIPNSPNYHHMNCMVDIKENY